MKKILITFALMFSLLTVKMQAVDIDIVPAVEFSAGSNTLTQAELTIYADFLLENMYIGFTGAYGNYRVNNNDILKMYNVATTSKALSVKKQALGLALKYDYFFENHTNLYVKSNFMVSSADFKRIYSYKNTNNNITYSQAVNIQADASSALEIGFAYGNLGLAVNYTYNWLASNQYITKQSDIETDTSYIKKNYNFATVGFKLFYLFNYSSN